MRPLEIILAFFLNHILKYRQSTIQENLKNSFPELSDESLRSLISKNYKVIARYVVESLGSFTMDQQMLKKFVNFTDTKHLLSEASTSTHTFILSSHFGNWEMITPLIPLHIKATVYGIYHPLSNKVLDQYLLEKRGRYGLKLITMAQAPKVIISQTTPSVFVLISDQSPAVVKGGVWLPFFGRPTYFFNSVERFVSKVNARVFIQSVEISEDRYNVSYHEIKKLEGSIMAQYASELEKEISNKPEYWLWSHKRWKLNKG